MKHVDCRQFDLSQFSNRRKVILPPGSSTKLHNHIEHEVWIVKYGQAHVCVDETKNPLRAGDVIYMEPFECHVVSNESDSEFIMEAYWDMDLAYAVKKVRYRNSSKQNTIIQTAFPTPNGNLHIGHLSGAYLYSDIYRRFLQLTGSKSYQICGTFGYTNHIIKSCHKNKTTYNDLVKQYETQIKKDLASFGCEYDSFLYHDSNKTLEEAYPKFLSMLRASGCLYEKVVMHPFSVYENAYIAESYVVGHCAHCNALTLGLECESCGFCQDEVEMLDIKQAITQEPLTHRPVKRTYFELKREVIEKIYNRIYTSRSTATNRCLNLFQSYLDKAVIKDIPVTSLRGFGIPYGNGQHLSMVFERILRTFYSLTEYPECMRYYIFCGMDNYCATAIFLPCVINQLGYDFNKTPLAVLNDFCLLDDHKFSTSRSHAIWAKDLLSDNNMDYLRSYLISISSDCAVSRFKLSEFNLFQKRYAKEFMKLKKLIATLKGSGADRNTDSGDWLSNDKEFLNFIDFYSRTCMNCYSTFDNRLALSCLERMLNLIIEYIQTTLKFSGDNNNYRTKAWLSFYSLKLMTDCLSPIMPNLSKELRSFIS